MQESDIQRLEQGHLQSRLLFEEARRNYVAQRTGLINDLTRTGSFTPQQAENLLLSAENLWLPDFDTFSSRGPDAMGSPNAEYLSAIRKEVGIDKFNTFVASLRDLRVREHQDQQVTSQLQRFVDPERFARLEAQTNDVEGYRQEMADMIQQINPAMKIAGVEKGLQAGIDPASDPLSQTIAVSLDPSRFNSKSEIHRELFESIAEGLTEKERAILDEAFGSKTRYSEDKGKTWLDAPEGYSIAPDNENPSVGTLVDADGVVIQAGVMIKRDAFEREKSISRAAEQFSKMVADKRKPDPLVDQALKPFKQFFERSKNLLNGRGFQSVEDVFKKAQRGQIGTRAAAIGAKPGLRMPLPSDNPAGANKMRNSIRNMTAQELALAIKTQKEVLQERRTAQYSLTNRLFRYRDLNSQPETAHGKTVGNKAKRRDRAELKQLTRGLTALLAEQRKRSRQYVAETLNMPDPGARQGRKTDGNPRVMWMDQMSRTQRAQMPVHDGHITVSPSAAESGRFDVKWHHPDVRTGIPLASEATEAGAFAMIQAFKSVSTGPHSPQAERLVGEINRAGTLNNADIKVLQNSDLLDKGLDAAIQKRDLKAFVYPLKTGDVVFQLSDGSWHTGRREEFIAVAKQVGDKHMQAAADELQSAGGLENVVPLNRNRDGSNRQSAPSPAPKQEPAQSNVAKQTPEPGPDAPAPLAAAASAGQPEPFRVNSNATTVIDAARNELTGLSSERLEAMQKATGKALDKAANESERMELSRGKLLIAETLKEKGIQQGNETTSTTPETGPYKPSANSTKERERLKALPDSQLKAMLKATEKAIKDAPTGNAATPKAMRDRQTLETGRTALQEVMRSKGIELHGNIDAKASQAPRAKKAGPKM